MQLESVIERIGDYCSDAILITEAEPFRIPGPRILWCNRAFTAMMGYQPEEVIGQTPRMLQRDDFDPEVGRRITERLDRWDRVREVVTNYTKDGRRVFVELDIVPIADETGWFHFWLAVQRDVTDRILAEQRIVEAERRFEIAASVSLIGVWDWDVRTEALYWSQEFMNIVGITEAEFSGDFSAFESRLHPDDRDRVLTAVNDHLERDIPYTIEYRLKHAQGHYVDIRARGSAQRDAEGELIRMVGSVQDISDQIAYEADLKAARDEADRASAAKSQFLANMSHEMRTPLNGILGMTHLLQRTGLDERQNMYVADIGASGTVLRSLVEDVLDISRIEAGEIVLAYEAFRLRDVFNGAADAVRGAAAQKPIEFKTGFNAGETVTAQGDPKRLRQVLINLLGNAIKFTDTGTVRFTARLLGRNTIRVEVEDTGCGIPAEAQDRVFERFQQGDGSDSRAHGGSGLGLSIVKGIVEQQGARIGFSSQEGEGSRFVLDWPLNAGDPLDSEDELEVLEKSATAAAPQILVVEDNATNQAVMRGVLELEGYEVTSAWNGQQGLDALKSAPETALILLDLQMPVMTGEEMLGHLRRDDHPNCKTPVIVVTASADPSLPSKMAAVGAQEVLTKPFDPEGLLDRVRSFVSGAQ
ncbi:hybrid sensor histidine kinase/response regulator [Maricaulis sp.]|uniref:hybrid sensor histidine kinase/response regulator n=1 Tax=Maricaulis sp. TaxID=1486257 RepID=UPI00260A4809|nr:hybrid sensor histidine kinase/response regulator [Maricaulis sp.]